jgi:hypothetical protein
MRRSLPLVLAILALLPMTVSAARAATDEGGWWVGADAWFAELSNVNLDVALEADLTVLSGGDVISMDYGAEFSGRLRGGWAPKDRSKMGYSASYWSWDNDESLEEGDEVNPTLSDPLFANAFSESVESDVSFKAEIIDLMMSRRMLATRRSTWTWGGGLRYAAMDQEWNTLYIEPFLTPGEDETVDISSESTGYGLTGGIGGS